MDKLAFLLAPRFWKLFLLGVVTFAAAMANDLGVWNALVAGGTVWLGGSVGVRTIDRFGEKIGAKKAE